MADLSTYVAGKLRDGWRVEANVGSGVVLVKGHRPNHLLHFLITILTCGAWLLVWAALSVASGEKRVVVREGQDGVARPVSGGLHPATRALLVVVVVYLFGACIIAMTRSSSGPRATAPKPASSSQMPISSPSRKKASKKTASTSQDAPPMADEKQIPVNMVMDGPEDHAVSAVLNTRVDVAGHGLSSETVSGALQVFQQGGGFTPQEWRVRFRKTNWEVRLVYLDAGRRRSALWTYDPTLSRVEAADSNARLLSWIPND